MHLLPIFQKRFTGIFPVHFHWFNTFAKAPLTAHVMFYTYLGSLGTLAITTNISIRCCTGQGAKTSIINVTFIMHLQPRLAMFVNCDYESRLALKINLFYSFMNFKTLFTFLECRCSCLSCSNFNYLFQFLFSQTRANLIKLFSSSTTTGLNKLECWSLASLVFS